MKARIYERLSAIYDLDWGDWSHQYVAFVRHALQQEKMDKARIIDLACGTGNLAIELARIGYSVLGADISPEMIEVAKCKADGADSPRFKVANMASLHIDGEFDCATCTFDSLNYLLSLEQVRAMFGGVGRILAPRGLFIFDCVTEPLFLHHHKDSFERKLGGISFLQKLRYDRARRIATTVFEFSDGTKETHLQRPYDLGEIGALLDESGFEIATAVSGFCNQPYTRNSERLICIARKREGK